MISDILDQTRSLFNCIAAEEDARTRMQHCRRAIGLGRSAVREADLLSDAEIIEVQDTLRLAHRVSLGMYNLNTSITKLAKFRMERLGILQLPILSATKPKNVVTDTACLAISDSNLPDNWYDTSKAVEAMNAEQFGLAGVGSDGVYSVCLRLIDAKDHFLEPAEYKNVVEVLPAFAISVDAGRLYFGPAENLQRGVGFLIANGRYVCSLATIRSGRRLRFLATMIQSDDPVPNVHQIPDFREI